jgi:hypothetical protein
VGGGEMNDPEREGARCRHAVYRLAWHEKGPISQPFLGEENSPEHARGSDNRHFNLPCGLACDAKGRLYVSDFGNDRIQVFSPKGEYLKTIPCRQPRRLDVHHETGEIYVHCWGKTARGGRRRGQAESRIVKFSGFDRAKVVKTWNVPVDCPHRVFCLDSWTKPVRVWLASRKEGRSGVPKANVQVYEETGNGFKPVCDFAREVRKDGYNFHMMTSGYLERLNAVRNGHLYYGGGKATTFSRIDPEEGRKFVPIGFEHSWPCKPDEIIAGEDGYIYIRAINKLGRFKPPTTPWESPEYSEVGELPGVQFTTGDEVPFDYGETVSSGPPHNCKLRGVIKVPSQAGGNGFCMGADVAPNGDVWVMCEINAKKPPEEILRNTGAVGLRVKRELKAGLPYTPHSIPGVCYAGQLVFAWDKHGKIKAEDLVPGMGNAYGIRGDKWGNVYVGASYRACAADGKLHPEALGRSGTLCKFPPQGGKFYGKLGQVSLDTLPDRPRDFSAPNSLWARNLLWRLPGVGIITGIYAGCACPGSRFDTDIYGRSFAPRYWRFSVAIVDTNGNRITEIGRWGNADSGRGPDSPVKVKGGIALAHCSYLCTVTDKWLYLNDSGSNRVIRLKLGYEAEERMGLR